MAPEFTPGNRLSVHVGDRSVKAGKTVSTASVNGHICRPTIRVNRLLLFSFRSATTAGNYDVFSVNASVTRPSYASKSKGITG